MKPEQMLLPLAAAFAFSLAGCSKQDSPPPSADDAQKAAAPAADALKQTADSAKAAAETAVADATKQAQEWIDKAKSLIAENKFSEASSALQQLTGLNLTAEQQKLVDSLKAQIQKALTGAATSEGASAAGDLLKKK